MPQAGAAELQSAARGEEGHNRDKGLSSTNLALLGTLGSSVLPALEKLLLDDEPAASPDGVQRLAAGLGAGALPTVLVRSFS